MRIYSIDPGTTTGIARWNSETGSLHLQQIGPNEHHAALYRDLALCGPTFVVCESFTFRPNPGRKKVVLDSREYIGVAKLFCSINVAQYVEQQPSQAKGFWKDDKIKALGLWEPGQKHAMDALRHLLYFRVFKLGHKELLEALK